MTGRAHSHKLEIRTASRTHLLDITGEIRKLVEAAGVVSGICHLYVPHTTAGILINEGDDPSVAADIGAALARLAPMEGPYKHMEGNSDAHIKAALVGSSESVFIEHGQLLMGRWQAIFFCEFDGPRDRELHVRITSD